MPENNLFTILIQGPIRNNLYQEYLTCYKKYGDVVFVAYKNDNTDQIEKEYPWVKFIKIDIPDTSNCFNFNNTFLQTNGILVGLNNINTEFTIRVRSDESFPNMDKFIENIKNHSDKIHVSNLYSFRDHVFKFCLGNHIFASKTEIAKKAFSWAYNACIFNNKDIDFIDGDLYVKDTNGKLIKSWSEILQTISFIKALNVNLDSENSKNIIKQNFYMTPLRDFPNFKWAHKFNNYQPITSENTDVGYDPNWEYNGSEPNNFMTRIEDI